MEKHQQGKESKLSKREKRHDVRGYQVTKMLPSRVVESRVQEEGWWQLEILGTFVMDNRLTLDFEGLVGAGQATKDKKVISVREKHELREK